MLAGKDITFSRGAQLTLDRVSLSVAAGDRVGIVGPNGIGKSTLLGILAGVLVPDSGVVERAPSSMSVGLLSQEPDGIAGETLGAYLSRRTGVAGVERDLDRLTAALAEDPGAIDDYSTALERYLALGGDDFEARAAVVCADVGLPPDRMDVAIADLSGGQAARAGLAAMLLSRFDVLLLDEPTNDLDFAGLERLEGFVGSSAGAVVVVSHDRAFLDRSVSRMLEIAEHTHHGTEFAGGWSDYVERRALARRQAGASYGEWSAQRARLQERIRSQRSWSERGVGKTTKAAKDSDKVQRGFSVNRTEKQASKVRTSERALERLGRMDKPWEGWELRLDLRGEGRSGDVVARLDHATVQRGGFCLGPVDLEIGWAERVAVVGPNGGGKSTLLRALTGEIALSGGRSWVGPGVSFGRLDQGRSGFNAAASLLGGFVEATGVLAEEARSTLAKFGLGAEHVHRRAAALSPGERTRAQLAAFVASGVNCLVLDEPTNHLDLPAIEQLEEALEQFGGTVLLVTHDRWMLETVSLTRTVEVSGGVVSDLG